MMHCRTFENNLNICLWKWRSTFLSDFEYLITLLTCADIWSFNQTFADQTLTGDVHIAYLKSVVIWGILYSAWLLMAGILHPVMYETLLSSWDKQMNPEPRGHDACWNGEWLWTASWCAECGTWWPWYCELSVRQWDSFALHRASNLPELWRVHSTSHY